MFHNAKERFGRGNEYREVERTSKVTSMSALVVCLPVRLVVTCVAGTVGASETRKHENSMVVDQQVTGKWNQPLIVPHG